MVTARGVLVDLPNWLGDVLHALPAVQRLAAALPDGAVAVALPKALLPLARLAGVPTVVRPPRAAWRWGRVTWGGRLAVAVTARHSTRAKLLVAATGARRRLASAGRGAAVLGLETFSVDRRLHQRHDLDGALAALGIARVGNEPFRLALPASLRRQGERWRQRVGRGKRLAALLPGSSNHPAKRYPVTAYGQVARRLLARGVVPVVLGGPGDEELAAVLARVPGVRLAPLAMPLDLAAGILAACDVAVGNDSGLTHLAAAVGCPTVALYGPTDPVRTAPVGGATVLAVADFRNEESWATLPPDEVAAVAAAMADRAVLARERPRRYDAGGGGPLAQLAEQGTLNP